MPDLYKYMAKQNKREFLRFCFIYNLKPNNHKNNNNKCTHIKSVYL